MGLPGTILLPSRTASVNDTTSSHHSPIATPVTLTSDLKR